MAFTANFTNAVEPRLTKNYMFRSLAIELESPQAAASTGDEFIERNVGY